MIRFITPLTLGGAPLPEGYGVLHSVNGTRAAKGTPQDLEWVGPEHEDPLRAALDAWVHATGATKR